MMKRQFIPAIPAQYSLKYKIAAGIKKHLHFITGARQPLNKPN
jgi:hypothetical protein